MKYKIGDKVWIKRLKLGEKYGDYTYHINNLKNEKNISEKEIIITGWYNNDESSCAYKCKEYGGITDIMINHNKTNLSKNQINYEIY